MAARTSVAVLIVLRVVIGLCQGVMFLCMHVLLSYWIPPLQRSLSASFVYAGTQIGVMVAFPVSGVLCVHGFDGGWPSIFYVFETCAEWGTYSFLTNMPSYMEDVVNFDIRKTGFLASLPYLGFWIVSNVSAHLVDSLRKRGYISTTTARKIFNSIEDPGLTVAMLTLGMAMSGCQYGSGFLLHPVDIAPRYAGIVLGIANTTGALGGFFAPIAIGMITIDKSREQWKTVVYIAAAVYTFGAIFYVIFGSGELQSWARDEEDNQEINVEDKKVNLEIKPVDEEVTY